jgi:hypothetical protein
MASSVSRTIEMPNERQMRASSKVLAMTAAFALAEVAFAASALHAEREHGSVHKFASSLVCEVPLAKWLGATLVADAVQLALVLITFGLARAAAPLGWLWSASTKSLRLVGLFQLLLVIYAHTWILGDTACATVQPDAYRAVRAIVWLFYLAIVAGIAAAVGWVINMVRAEFAHPVGKQD